MYFVRDSTPQPHFDPSYYSTATPPTAPNNNSVLGFANAGFKLFFLLCVIMQVVMSPSVMTITFASTLALHGLVRWFMLAPGEALVSFTEFGVLPLQGRKALNPKAYIFTCIVAAYMLIFFLLYAAHAMHSQPAMTGWIHPNYIHNYSFTWDSNNDFPGNDVTSSNSWFMRSNTYVWPRSSVTNAIYINGMLPMAGPLRSSISCRAEQGTAYASSTPRSSYFSCFAAKMVAVTSPPDSSLLPHNIVPMPSQFYTTDVMITPPAGTPCSSLEAYRIVYDSQGNVEYGLDYPAAASTSTSSAPANTSVCGLFSDPAWCLAFQHSFSASDYAARVASKCTTSSGSLIFRLPPRAVDVDPQTGKMNMDALLVTFGATVSFRYTWHSHPEKNELLTSWDQWSSTTGDTVQPWRDSSDDGPIFCKFAIAIIPLLMLWYYLAITFEKVVTDNQVLFLCLFILLPSILIFIAVGAWLPMSGAIICTIAINYSSERKYVASLLFFLTGLCNSIQFVWILAIVAQAGWSSLLYQNSLNDISNMNNDFLVSGTPTWVGLTMPIVLVINFCFFLGGIIGGVMEFLS